MTENTPESIAQGKIVIDLAGAMEKITPEMLDEVRDLMIAGLTKSGTTMLDALKEIISLCDAGATRDEIAAVAEKAIPS